MTCKSWTNYCKSRTLGLIKAKPAKACRDYFYPVTYINYLLTYLTVIVYFLMPKNHNKKLKKKDLFSFMITQIPATRKTYKKSY